RLDGHQPKQRANREPAQRHKFEPPDGGEGNHHARQKHENGDLFETHAHSRLAQRIMKTAFGRAAQPLFQETGGAARGMAMASAMVVWSSTCRVCMATFANTR